jgi:hypothetical protein
MYFIALLEEFAQWLQPKEIRIPAVKPVVCPNRIVAVDPDPELVRKSEAIVVETAIALWQIRSLVADPGQRAAQPELADVWGSVENAFTDLKMSGVEIGDMSGQRFERGDGLRAIFVKRPSLTEPTILSMEEPRVWWRGKQIHAGKGIVGEPVKN